MIRIDRCIPVMLMISCLCVPALTGCEHIYYLLQKEGAEEKELIGEALPLEYNENVAEVQQLLKLYGYSIGTIDGKMGPTTRNAVVKFQKDNQLEETRFIDKATWEKLHQFQDSGLVANGQVSIKVLQQALNNAGYSAGRVDGNLGPQSKRALIAFQKAKGLKPDGMIGIKTLQALAQYLTQSPEAS